MRCYMRTIKEAILAVIAQGKHSVDVDGTCMYRGPDGLKCVVGHMISDEEYSPELEGSSACSVEISNLVPGHTGYNLLELQHCHDSALDNDFVNSFKANLRKSEYAHILEEIEREEAK